MRKTAACGRQFFYVGEEAGEMCWAVFLPAEMSGHARIRFSGYETVTMKALGEDDYNHGARLGLGEKPLRRRRQCSERGRRRERMGR